MQMVLKFATMQVASSVRQMCNSKSESPDSPDSADNFEFSAERLSENAKNIKIMLFAELLTVISPSCVQSLQ